MRFEGRDWPTRTASDRPHVGLLKRPTLGCAKFVGRQSLNSHEERGLVEMITR